MVARSDDLLNRPDRKDLSDYAELVRRALQAKRTIETGFLELAESIFEINKTKLYRVRYATFGEFCEEELGFSRQTIYVYLSILQLMAKYGRFFPRKKVVELGHKKMRHITEGVNAIDRTDVPERTRERVKTALFRRISPEMASTEIEAMIEDVLSAL